MRLRLLVVLLALLGGSAHADIIGTFTDRSSFDAAVGVTELEDFNSFVADTPFPVDVGDFTITQASVSSSGTRNLIEVPPLLFPLGNINVDGTALVNVLTFAGNSTFLSFDTPITAFGADLSGLNDNGVRTRIVVGGEVITPPITRFPENRFFGFVSDTPFSIVEFRAVSNDGYGIDNVSYTSGTAPVPEPSSLALFGVAILGYGIHRRRRRAS